jgi:hypothetical protein
MSTRLQLKQTRQPRLQTLVSQADILGKNVPYIASQESAEIVYDALNRSIFGNTLPRPKLIVRDYKTKNFWGECEGFARKSRWGEPYTKYIRLQKHWPNFQKFINVVAHEMVHQWEWETHEVMTHGQTTFFIWKDTMKQHGVKLGISG